MANHSSNPFAAHVEGMQTDHRSRCMLAVGGGAKSVSRDEVTANWGCRMPRGESRGTHTIPSSRKRKDKAVESGDNPVMPKRRLSSSDHTSRSNNSARPQLVIGESAASADGASGGSDSWRRSSVHNVTQNHLLYRDCHKGQSSLLVRPSAAAAPPFRPPRKRRVILDLSEESGPVFDVGESGTPSSTLLPQSSAKRVPIDVRDMYRDELLEAGICTEDLPASCWMSMANLPSRTFGKAFSDKDARELFSPPNDCAVSMTVAPIDSLESG